MTTSLSLEEMLNKQCQELEDLEIATVLIRSKDALKEELSKMHTEVSHVRSDIARIKKCLEQMRDQNHLCRELMSLLDDLHKRIIHMERNVPLQLIHDYIKSEKHSSSTTLISKEEHAKQSEIKVENVTENGAKSMKDCKKMLFNDPEVCPRIPLITEEEYNKIPKYIIRRQSLEMVNNLINAINQTVKAKYTFLSLGKAHARKQGDLLLFLDYKKQEMDICKHNEYLYFFTAEDYEGQTKSKLDKIKLNLLTVLRHCKRLREYRVKNDLRYVLTAK